MNSLTKVQLALCPFSNFVYCSWLFYHYKTTNHTPIILNVLNHIDLCRSQGPYDWCLRMGNCLWLSVAIIWNSDIKENYQAVYFVFTSHILCSPSTWNSRRTEDMAQPLADLGGRKERPLGQNFFIFMQFLGKNGQILDPPLPQLLSNKRLCRTLHGNYKKRCS